MDQLLIKSLIDALAASDLSELEYTAGGATLQLVKGPNEAVPPGRTAVPSSPPAVRTLPAARPAPAHRAEPDTAVVFAPAFGIVHLHRSPGTPPLVTVGDTVEVNQVLCLIEAMKVFTEMRAGRAGTLAAVLVETGQEVEAGQPLFRMQR